MNFFWFVCRFIGPGTPSGFCISCHTWWHLYTSGAMAN